MQELIQINSRWGGILKLSWGGGSPVSVNYYAYRDYITNRKALRDRNARKRVKPFDPAEVARLCPIVREVIVMEDEDD